MLNKRSIMDISIINLNKAEELFYNLIGMSKDKTPNKFKEVIQKVTVNKSSCSDSVCVSQSFIIEKIESDGMTLTTGDKLKGAILPNVFEGCSELVCFVITLRNSIHLENEDMTEQFFLDAWQSALVESGFKLFYEELGKSLSKEGQYLTASWCPGYKDFPIENQGIIFNLLKPEDIGVKLNESYMMKPIKSISGIIGVTKERNGEEFNNCEHCLIKDTCNYKGRGVCGYVRKS